MAADIELNRTISMSVQRCYDCGTFWACETRSGSGRCPICAGRKIDAAHEEQAKLEKRLNAQKAATSRAAKGRR